MTEKKYLSLGKSINSNISPIDYNSDFGKGLSEEARNDIEAIEQNYKTAIFRCDLILD